jgi:cell growth-regulating nucleolar protein
MVSFSCDACQDTIKKPGLKKHLLRCRNAQFTCIDCSKTFYDYSYETHTSCISESQKYQKHIHGNNPSPANLAKTPKTSIIAQIKESEPKVDKKRKSKDEDDSKSPKLTKIEESKNAKTPKEIIIKIAKKKSISLRDLEKKAEKKGLVLNDHIVFEVKDDQLMAQIK